LDLLDLPEAGDYRPPGWPTARATKHPRSRKIVTPMNYAIVTLDLPEALAEGVSALLHARGALGVEVRDAEGVPPGAAPPLAGRAAVLGYFAAPDEAQEAMRHILGRYAEHGVTAEVGECRDEDWAESWKDHFPPLHVGGALWIVPPWVPRPEGPAVVLEPGMAFGTGAHSTTALCLEALVEILGRRPGARVLDVGSGSGILGIAARALGATRVVMIDDDPDAVRIARENALSNGAADVEVAETPIAGVEGLYDVVVANILSTTLVELARPIAARRAVGGTILLSGILTSQADEVRDAYAAFGLAERERRVQGEWVMLRLEGR
jgi:ribosomal protein L11 methyltransferase